MTNKELNTSLYEKCFAAQEHYREWLLSLPPEEILNHTGSQLNVSLIVHGKGQFTAVAQHNARLTHLAV